MSYEAEATTRVETYLKAIATGEAVNLPPPVTMVDYALKYMAENGISVPAAGGATDYTDAKALAALKNKTQIKALKTIEDPSSATSEHIATVLNMIITALKA